MSPISEAQEAERPWKPFAGPAWGGGPALLWRGGRIGILLRLLPWPLILAGALVPLPYNLGWMALRRFGFAPWDIDAVGGLGLLFLCLASCLSIPVLLRRQARRDGQPVGRRVIRVAICLVLALWLVEAWRTAAFLGGVLPHMARQGGLALSQRAHPWMELSADGTDLTLRTEYVWGVADRVKAFVRVHPGVRSLTLSGPGGIGMEGADLARFVMDRGLETRVQEPCYSACATVFLSGRRRLLKVDGGEGLLGLHAAHIDDGTKYEKQWDEETEEVLRRAGATAPFLWKIWETDPATLWRPTPRELRLGGLPVEVIDAMPASSKGGAD